MELKDQLSRFAGEPTLPEGEITETMAARPEKNLIDHEGVLFLGYWRTRSDGMARHARAAVKAMASVGVPVQLGSMGFGEQVLSDELDPEAKKLEYLTRVTFSRPSVVIKHILWKGDQHLRKLLLPASTGFCTPEETDNLLRRTIVYTSWERDALPEEEVALLNRCGQVWVPCEDNYNAFVQSGVDPDKVKQVPFCFDPDEEGSTTQISLPRGKGTVESGKRFYSIGKWEPRKNQHRLIGAFLRAFKATDKASLFIKTSGYGNWSNYPTPPESIEYWLDDPTVQGNGWNRETLKKKFRLVEKTLSNEDIVEIHRKNNIYVSSSHGEAWDIPAFEAKLAGNRMIYTDWGGPPEYATRDDFPLPWTWVPVDSDYHWWESNWANIKTEDLIGAMQRIEPPARRVLPPLIVQFFSRFKAGSIMRRRILDLLESFENNEGRVEGGFG